MTTYKARTSRKHAIFNIGNRRTKIAFIFVFLLLGVLGLQGFGDEAPHTPHKFLAKLTEKLSSVSQPSPSSSTFSHSHSSVSSSPPTLPLPPNPIPNFQEAKKIAKHIFRDNRKTLYCDCKFDKHNKIDLNSCGYFIQNDKRRAMRLEWEHIVPISHLAANFLCWKKPLCCNKKGECYRGRRCCQESDPDFAKMEADLHNLVPELGELNALRSNFRFGMLPHIAECQFGDCEIKIDPETRRVEPRAKIRGTIARAYLYMSVTYGFHLSDSQRQLFNAWNAQYPPDEWEIEWDNRIFLVQGNHNPYISRYVDMFK